MSRISPTLEGFRTTFRRPSLTLAEIAWRWTVGAFAWALLLFWFIEYLDTLPVTKGDATLLSTRQPFLVGRAIAHILRGSLNRAVLAALFAVIAMSLLWIIAASIGRGATVRALLDHFRRDTACTEEYGAAQRRPLRSLIGLNFLRAALTLAALLAIAGAAVLVSFASPAANPQPALVFILFLPLAGLIWIVWSALNWLLSLAAIFAVRDGEDALGALSAGVALFWERLGPVSAVSTWTGLAHLTAFSVFGTALSMPLAFIHVAPSRLVIAAMILVTLAYLAVVDWLYIGRLAGYVCIAEMPETLAESLPLTIPPPRTSIDRDEPILSDLPNLIAET
ncbi:MAG TPA: hypothetical protein VNX26_12790 [Candidatus Acidoferrum sp.]|jgi:hypothetical protein|nr:hypothetical protein [Candidatus Acidoferrum sp.]